MNRMTILVVVLLLGGMTLYAAAPMMAQTGGLGPGYTVQASAIAGGGYQLTSLRWQVSGMAGGGSYRLLDLASAGPWGNCCCTFLPLILRNK